MVEDGFALCVEFHNVGTLGGNQTYIVLNLCVGVGIVDVYAFVDMAKAEHRQQLYDHMREIMANDRARHNILPLSKFGLMQRVVSSSLPARLRAFCSVFVTELWFRSFSA